MTVKPSKQGGWGFGIPALAPGLLSAAAITLGAPVVGAASAAVITVGTVSAVAAVTGFSGLALVGGSAGFAGAVATAAVAATAAAGWPVLSFAVAAAALGIAGATLAGIAAADRSFKKYNPEKVFDSTLAGATLGAFLSGAAIVNVAQAPDHAEEPPSSTLHIETRGGGLCENFKLTDGATATVIINEKGRTLTIKQDCTLR